MAAFLNDDVLRQVDREAFARRRPFPWMSFDRLLKPGGFRRLMQDFPSVGKFEQHLNILKAYGQRPHNRYYLAYERSVYGPRPVGSHGLITHAELAESWQGFLAELEGDVYREFVSSMLGSSDFVTRYAWHLGVTGSEVSPHRDSDEKLGTHIFYFNAREEWSREWGGEMLVLGGKKTAAMNPEFADFETAEPVEILDNRNFLFKNDKEAWHGVRTLTCPLGRFRRLFNVIFDRPGKSVGFSVVGRLRRLRSLFAQRAEKSSAAGSAASE